MRWQVRLAELRHRRGEPGDAPALAVTWNTLASLIDLHMAADEEVCGPAIYGTRPHGRDLARETGDAHEDIREIIREASQYPPGSALWWALVTAALAAWTRYLHREVYGPLAGCRRRADPAFAPLACVCPACTHELDQVPDPASPAAARAAGGQVVPPAEPEPAQVTVLPGTAGIRRVR